jgi:hypothetical protein
LAYSNFYRHTKEGKILKGYNYKYSKKMLENIRQAPFFLNYIVTYRTSHLLSLKLDDLKDSIGSYPDSVFEQAIYYPLVERLCGRIIKIDEYAMLVKEEATYKDFIRSKLKAESLEVRAKPPLSCGNIASTMAEPQES